MTVPTPEQMRALAERSRVKTSAEDGKWHWDVAEALHTVAKQIEAVQATLDRYAITDDYNPGMEWTDPEDVWRLFRDLRAVLTSDIAPQEDHHE